MSQRSDDSGNDNWRRLWESNKKSHRRRVRAWLQRLSSSPSPPVAPTVHLSASTLFDTIAMTSNPVIQRLEDQFLHWHQDMEKKQENQARQMRELQNRVKHLQRENYCLRAQVEKKRDLGERDGQDSDQARHPTAPNKGKEPIIPNDVDTPADDELPSGSLPNHSSTKSCRARSCQRHSYRPAFNNAENGTICRVRRETDRGQNQPNEVPMNTSALPIGVMLPIQLGHPTFDIGLTLYIPSTTTIRSPDDMLSSPLGRHIPDYEPLRDFFIPTFTMFDGFTDPYDHMLHYNQAMTLNADNDLLLCKVFPASLRGPTLIWFHKLPRNSIKMFY